MKHFRISNALPFVALVAATLSASCAPSVTADLSHVVMVRAPACAIPRIGEVKLRRLGSLRAVPATIDGHAVSLLLDTGSSDVVIAVDAAKDMDLPETQDGTMVFSTGLGGLFMAKPVWTHDFEIAGFDLRHSKVGLAGLKVPADQMPPVVGLLGAGYLSAFDIDIDFARDRMTLYGSRHCADGFVPWSQPFDALPTTLNSDGDILVDVTLDGVPLKAMVDTGAMRTVLMPSGVQKLKLSPGELGKDPTHAVETADGHDATMRIHRFGGLAISRQLWPQPYLAVQPTTPRPDPRIEAIRTLMLLKATNSTKGSPEKQAFPVDMVLGDDFLGRYEVWISYAENRIFLAPASAPAPADHPG